METMEKAIYVTGITGFIGRNLLTYLSKKYIKVINFTRRDTIQIIEQGHISLHPAGIPHGPHPGATERSIGKSETGELAVMVDTFKPLQITEEAMKIADEEYYKSWLE